MTTNSEPNRSITARRCTLGHPSLPHEFYERHESTNPQSWSSVARACSTKASLAEGTAAGSLLTSQYRWHPRGHGAVEEGRSEVSLPGCRGIIAEFVS
jgi:hypothetical protein